MSAETLLQVLAVLIALSMLALGLSFLALVLSELWDKAENYGWINRRREPDPPGSLGDIIRKAQDRVRQPPHPGTSTDQRET